VGLAWLMLLPLVGSYDRLSRVTTAGVIVLDHKTGFLLACAGQMLTSRPQPFCFLVGAFFFFWPPVLTILAIVQFVLVS